MMFQEAAKKLAEIDARGRAMRPYSKPAIYCAKTAKFGILLLEAHGIKDARKMAWQRFRVGPRDVWRKTFKAEGRK
jgi:hypothetical protein